MSLSPAKTFDLLEFLAFSLSGYLKSKICCLDIEITASNNPRTHFDIALEFSMSFIDFVRKILLSHGIRRPANHLIQILEENFLNEIGVISNPKAPQMAEEKPFSLFMRNKLGKTSAYKFQMLVRLLLLRNLFESEMISKERNCSSTKQKLKKELFKLVDMVRISMQMEDEDFTEFYLLKIFVLVKDSNSLNFHNFLIDLCKTCELPDQILEKCKENLEKLRQRGREQSSTYHKIPENLISATANIPANELERTISTLTTEGSPIAKISFSEFLQDLLKFSFPTSLSSFIEKEYSENTKVIPEIPKAAKKQESPAKNSFSIDQTRKKIFSDIMTNNQKNIQNGKSQNSTVIFQNPQIQEESDSRSSSMVSLVSNHLAENVNRNLNSTMMANGFAKPKMGRNFGTTFGRKVVQLPVVKKNCGIVRKKNSIFDQFFLEVQEKILDRQLNKETCSFLQKTFNIPGREEDESSDLPDLLSWNNVVAYNTPIKEKDDGKNRNFDDLEVRSFKAV